MAITSRARRSALSKAGSPDQFIQGMDAASELIGFLQGLGSNIAGCILPAKRRQDGGVTNADIIEFQANPLNGPSRDLRPTEEDKAESTQIIKAAIMAKLQMISKTGKRYKRWDEAKSKAFVARGAKDADKIMSLALRRAGQAMKARMLDRLNGGGFDAVSDDPPHRYATRRLNKYGVPKTAVFRATGQLLSNIADGHIRLIRKPELSKILGGYASEIASMITG
jgi:hypothetical protein